MKKGKPCHWERATPSVTSKQLFCRKLTSRPPPITLSIACILQATILRHTGRSLTSIGSFFDSNSLIERAATAARLATSTGDPRVLDLVSCWLNICQSSYAHVDCSRSAPASTYCPNRLIDVGPSDHSHDMWRLAEFEAEAESVPYLTLSHRWGDRTIKLNHETHRSMLAGMSILTLPETYQDAIRVARHLKIRYLWIDSICIFQDERLDIQKEAVSILTLHILSESLSQWPR